MRRVATVMLVIAALILIANVALAQEEGTAEKKELSDDVKKFVALAGGLAIAIAAFGGALGQARAAAAALEGIARNPGAYNKVFTPMILGLALIESLVLYALIISFLLVFKL